VSAIASIGVNYYLSEEDESFNGWQEGVSILSAILVASLVSAWSDYQKES